jgi:hypothetical protein
VLLFYLFMIGASLLFAIIAESSMFDSIYFALSPILRC